MADDGVIEALIPVSGHPTALEAEQADAYYLMPSWEGEAIPEKGNFIEVELRPEVVTERTSGAMIIK